MEGAAGMDSSNSVDNLEGDPVVGGAQNWGGGGCEGGGSLP